MEYPLKRHIFDKGFAHRELIVILTVFVLLSFAYSLVLPLGEADDEISHFALIRFIAEQKRPPMTLEERRSLGNKGDASPIYHGLVALLTQHVSVPALPSLPELQQQSERLIPFDGLPVDRLFHTENEAFPFHGIVLAWHLARLASIPLGAVMIIAAYVTTLAIYPGRRYFASAVAGFVAFVPRFVINSAVLNDDNLAVPLAAFSIYYLVRVAQGNEQRRTFVMLGGLMGLATATKYSNLVLLPEMTVVLVVLAWRNQWGWRTWLRRWGWSVLAFLLASGWWFALLVIWFNQVAELGWVRGLIAPLGDPVVTSGLGRVFELRLGSGLSSGFSWSDWAKLTFRSFWISYGWLQVWATPTVYRVLGLFTLMAVLGLVNQGWRQVGGYTHRCLETERSEVWRLDISLLVFHFFVYLSVIVLRYLLSPTPETAQGRHLYPVLVSVAFFLVMGWGNILQMLRWLPASLRQIAQRQWFLPPCDKALALGVSSALIGLSVLTPPLFILPVYFPYLPIVTAEPGDIPIAHRLTVSFAKGLDFEGYDLELPQARAGETLPVTLYWHAGGKQERDYLIRVCLRDDVGQWVICRQGYPVDGRYPMRAWEVGYLIRDKVYLPIPSCLPTGNYDLTLSVLPLRLDTASTTVDETAEAGEPLVLGRVALSDSQRTQPSSFDLWVGDKRRNQGNIELRQIRQALIVIHYWSPQSGQNEQARAVRLLPASLESSSGMAWSPVASDVTYQCPAGPFVSVHNFIVDPNIKPGRYRLEVSNQIESEPVITVMANLRDFSSPADIPTQVGASFAGEVELLGYGADLSPRWPGDIIYITTYWRALRTMSRSYIGSFHLLDYTMTMWGQSDQSLGGPYRNILWAPGETVKQEYNIPISAQTPPGLYTIEFSVYVYTEGAIHFLPVTTAANPEPVEHLYLGQVRVMDPAQTQSPSHPVIVELEDQIQLLGFDLSSERLTVGQPLHLTLHWQAINRPKADYTVFTQLIGPDGQVWGQQDNQPQGGRYPTTAWALRDRVTDRYELRLREGAPPGQYRLLVGMYNLATGQRLTAIGEDNNHLSDNAILLATLTLE